MLSSIDALPSLGTALYRFFVARRALKKEKLDARLAILPLIQAEEDQR